MRGAVLYGPRRCTLRGTRGSENHQADGRRHQDLVRCVCGSDLWPYRGFSRLPTYPMGTRLRHRGEVGHGQFDKPASSSSVRFARPITPVPTAISVPIVLPASRVVGGAQAPFACPARRWPWSRQPDIPSEDLIQLCRSPTSWVQVGSRPIGERETWLNGCGGRDGARIARYALR